MSTVTSAELAGYCRESRTPFDADFCTAYIVAVYDRMSMAGAICPHMNGSMAQAIAVGRKRLADRPEDWSRHPAFILSDAFASVFPCR